MSSPSLQHVPTNPAERVASVPSLRPELVQRITEESFLALKSLPKRGAEIGGILASSSAKGAETVVIESLRLVPTEHRFGPSYILSPSDISDLREQIQAVEAAGSSVVAYFRSCTRDELTVSDDDRKIINEELPGARFLVIAKPFLNGNVLIGYFEALPDGAWSNFHELECGAASFSSPRNIERQPAGELVPLPPAAASEISAPLVVQPPEAVRAVRRESMPAMGRVRARLRVRYSVLFWAALLLLVCTAPVIWILAARLRASNGLELRVERQKESLRVTWNRRLPVTESASGGVLNIQDGDSHRAVLLDAAQIAAGSVVYTPHENDVTFHLEIRGPGQEHQGEFVRVLNGEPAPAKEPVAPSGQGLPALAVEANPNAPADSEEVAARPLRQVIPHLSSSPGPTAQFPVRVQIRVHINERGHVVRANEVRSTPFHYGFLSAEAVRAARQWAFVPATKNGKNVKSEYLIDFLFGPVKQ